MADFSGSGVKTCTKCKVEQPLAEFYQRRSEHRTGASTSSRHYAQCRTCCTAKVKAYQTKHRDKVLAYKREWSKRGTANKGWRERHFKRAYSSTEQAYDLQLTAQHGRCAVCLREPAKGEQRFPFDHDHENGLTRGVLCAACNGGLGCFKDRPDLLRNALTYLAEWAARHSMEQASGL